MREKTCYPNKDLHPIVSASENQLTGRVLEISKRKNPFDEDFCRSKAPKPVHNSSPWRYRALYEISSRAVLETKKASTSADFINKWSGRQMVHLGKEINELDKNVRAFNLTLILLISSVLTKLGDSG